MKRLLIILVACLLLMTACANNADPETTADTTAATEPTDPGLYVPGSDIEQQTNGAVRRYDLNGNSYTDVFGVGERVILTSGSGQITFEALTGDRCTAAGSATLPQGLWQLTNNGIAYYDMEQNQAVYLDSQLQELKRIDLPEGLHGAPAFSPDGAEVYYCIEQEVRGLDTQRGVSRLIKSHSATGLELLGTCFDGKLLVCRTDDEGDIYIATENGSTRGTDTGIITLDTYEDNYFATRMDGVTTQNIFGTWDGSPQQLNAAESRLKPALELGGAVGLSTDDAGNVTLSFYELASGKKTAFVTLPGAGDAQAVWADRRSGQIWVLAAPKDEDQSLYSWNVKASAVAEETVYVGPVYTRQAPDTAGLDTLQDRVDALNKQYVTAIRIWESAVKTPAGHTLEPEYQIPAISKSLDELEAVMARFPENFLSKSVNTRIRVCIVRSVDGEAKALRYWDDGDAFIVLSAGVDIQKEFISAMGYIVDIHTLGNSPMLDAWEGLNPEGFTYGSDPKDNLTYLSDDNRAFADEESMTLVSEERARLFYYAMLEDNAQMFTSQTMQAKLRLLCQAIRDAWRLERKTEIYTWEQYLTESIAYQK